MVNFRDPGLQTKVTRFRSAFSSHPQLVDEGQYY